MLLGEGDGAQVGVIAGIEGRNNGDPKSSRHFGFVIQFPAAYDKEFFCATEEEQSQWMKAITDVSGVRRIEDYYDIREKIGEGRFAEVYRVCEKWGREG